METTEIQQNIYISKSISDIYEWLQVRVLIYKNLVRIRHLVYFLLNFTLYE